MTRSVSERNRLALLGWLATVAMSLSFITAVRESRYIFLGAVSALVLVGAGMALRALRVPNLAVFVAQAVLLTWLLVWQFGVDHVWVFFPTGDTWAHIDTLITDGIDHAQRYPAPAPANAGLLLMLVFFISVIAILVDLAIATNRVPLAGLPLLALYTVPVAALPDGVPFISFLAGASAYVGLLTAAERERLAHWGRLVAHGKMARSDDSMDTRSLRSNGQRVAVLALAASVVVPIFIPTLSSSLLDDNDRLGTGDGSGDSLQFTDPMVSLASALRRDEEVDLIQVDSDVAPSYLRMTVLDEPGPNSWSTGEFDLSDTIPVNQVLPAPNGLTDQVEQTPHRMVIRPLDSFPSDSSWFPVPFDSYSIDLNNDDWSYFTEDQTVFARTQSSASRVDAVSVNYSTVDWNEEQLNTFEPVNPVIRDRYATVPDDIPVELINEARRITAGASTDYERAELLQAFFRDNNNFEYDVDAGYGYGYQAMVEFLDKRRGFCQHFAATMAMMARIVGIPSRVVTGFLNPTSRGDEGYVFTSHDLHAWPELYFEGDGWVRFEPTPNVGAALPSWANEASPTLGPTRSSPTATNTEDPFATRTNETSSSTEAAANNGQAAGGGGSDVPSPWWLLVPAGLALALTPALVRVGIRRRRLTRAIDESAAAEDAWLELRDRMRDLKMPWQGSMTPRARQQALAPLLRDDDHALTALRRLALAVERSRYSVSPLVDARPGQDAVTVMHRLDQTVGHRERVRAWLWPSSLMPDLARGWGRFKARVRRRPAPREA